jgi:hypothetical protein
MVVWRTFMQLPMEFHDKFSVAPAIEEIIRVRAFDGGRLPVLLSGGEASHECSAELGCV